MTTHNIPDDILTTTFAPVEVLVDPLIAEVTKAILFEDCGSSEEWLDNLGLGEAAIKAYRAHRPVPTQDAVPPVKLARSQMLSWKRQHLAAVQGGKCMLCGHPIDLNIKGEGVIDHDHNTGRIRGILHRSCNAAEGKVANAAGRWGAKSMDYADIIPWLRNLLEYLEKPQTRFVYPFHKTEDEKRLDRNAAARKARAAAKARQKLKELL